MRTLLGIPTFERGHHILDFLHGCIHEFFGVLYVPTYGNNCHAIAGLGNLWMLCNHEADYEYKLYVQKVMTHFCHFIHFQSIS